ncbi:MAG: glycosyltransferase family 2 protein [Candidatus Nanohaloarchaea archaeon]
MDFTAGIITYNRPQYVKRLLRSLDGQTVTPDEIVIVDDSDNRQTQEVISEFSDESDIPVRSFYSQGKTIQGTARNRIIEEAEGDVICFLDDDTVCSDGWLEAIEETYRENPDAAGVGGPALDVNEDLELLHDIERNEESQCTVNRYGEIEDRSDVWVPPRTVEVDLFRGANMSFRKDILEQIGGFDPGYGGNGWREETDVMAALRERGGKLLYNPEARVNHIQADSGGARMYGKEFWYWGARNHTRFLKKHFSERLYLSLLMTMFSTKGDLPPVWKLPLKAIQGDYQVLQVFRGYIEGYRQKVKT